MSDLTGRFDTSDLADFLLDVTWQGDEEQEQELFSCELTEIDESQAQLIEAASC